MQGLSSRAHAFSVEALVGKTSCKRLKAENCRDEKAPIDSKIKPQDTLACTVVDEEVDLDNQTEKRKCSPKKRKAKDGECELEKEVTAELQGSDLWNRFHEIGTEMIITKAGRRMFPSMRVKVKNLDHFKQYYIAMDIMPVDSKRYRYVYHSSQWMVAGNTDHTCIAPRLYVHPDSPCSGETWMRQVISFDRVKLTNNEMDDKGHIILQSMHKYKPRVHVIAHDPRVDRFQIQSLPTEGVCSFSFPETQFTTVTAYQNQQITKLKIDRNPFAKGFRDPGRNRGVLDGILESYPWRSPLSLDLKTFAIEPQEVLAGSTGCGSMPQLKGLLSSSCSPHSFPLCVPCSDATLRNLSRPLCYKGPPSAGLPGGRPCSLSEPLGTRGYSELRFVADYPFLSALHGKKGSDCRGQFFQGLSTNNPSQLYTQGFQAPGSSRIQQSQPFHGTLPPQLNSPYGLRGYNFPVGPHFTNVGQHLKLSGNMTLKSTDSSLPHLPWHPTVNHCL